MTSDMKDANKGRETQQLAPSNQCDSKAAEKAFTPEQSSHAFTIARHCQKEEDSTYKSGGYAMQRWLNESYQEGPWSAVVSDTKSANGEKQKTQQGQEYLSKLSNGSSLSPNSRRYRLTYVVDRKRNGGRD